MDLHPGLTGPVVTRPDSPRIKEAAKLAKRTWRTKARRFIVEGPQAVREALVRHGERSPAAVTLPGRGGADGESAPRADGAVVDAWATAQA
ncbi:MAG TPA: RNA methyltransferase, partial [Brevibacterium senegalense]|nr:RNA methyltransferase [Brevibacterium senegalense]